MRSNWLDLRSITISQYTCVAALEYLHRFNSVISTHTLANKSPSSDTLLRPYNATCASNSLPLSASIFPYAPSILSYTPLMASLLKLASFATLFATALSLPQNEPRTHCGSSWACTGDIGTPPALNMSALCSPTGPGYCNLGAYMVPRTTGVAQVSANEGIQFPGNVDLYIYDSACNQIGDLMSAYSISRNKSSLVPFDSELPEVVSVNNFAPPDGYGNNANIQFSYSTWTSPPLWNSKDSGYNDELNNSDDWFCWKTPSPTSTGATWLQVRI